MADEKTKTLFYKRSRFVTHLPLDYLYTPSHAWLAKPADGSWRVGLTKVATRMLGEMVDFAFELPPDSEVKHGQIIGWVEGFKAISDVYCVAEGTFLGANPDLKKKLSAIDKDCYQTGWLYAASGRADARVMDVHAYATMLTKAIDKILEQQKDTEIQ
ncbi:MAG: glycine cleavage system protein H [Burkholderiales bacterium]